MYPFYRMNYFIIVLGVIIILLLFYLYYYFTSTSTTLTSGISLNKNQVLFGDGQLKNPSATHYGYGIWLFINTWNTAVIEPAGTALTNMTSNTNGYNGPGITNGVVIFKRMDNSKMMLYLDSSKPSLYYAIADLQGTIQRQLITDNFPIQSWTQIIFSVDNNIVDIYMNGKLLLSNVYANGLAIPSASAGTPANGSTAALQLGNSSVAFDANASKFQQWSNMAVDPQTAWNSYMSGNGQSSGLSSYNVKLELLKDQITQSTISAF